MFCWRTICLSLSVMVLSLGTANFTHAQTIVREVEQQTKEGQTAVIGLIGEFSHCAAYQVDSQDLLLNQVVPRSGGLTKKSSGIIRIIRSGRVSQDLFYSPETAFPLMHGDILIALKSQTNSIYESFDSQGNANNRSQQQAQPELVQLAIVNLLDRPVVFGIQPEIADLAGILRCLRQPVEKYSQIVKSIKVISTKRVYQRNRLKTKRLTTKFSSATVLVLNAKTGIDLSLIPKSLPAPKNLQAQVSTQPETPAEQKILTAAPLETSPFQEVSPEPTPEVSVTDQKLREVTHPEDISLPAKNLPQKIADGNQPQLNGPLLQQTTASLNLVPKPQLPEKNAGDEKEISTADQAKKELTVAPENLQSNLKSAPLPPVESIQSLDDEDLDKYEELEANTSSASWLPWSAYLFFAFVAVMAWKYVRKKSKTSQGSSQNYRKQKSPSPEMAESKQAATVITNWDSLPPLPEKSLLEQILENEIPIIEEQPQIPTQTMIYGRHQSKKARIDQLETLKGPHFGKKLKTGPASSEDYESTKTIPLDSQIQTTEKKLKAPAFRFDRPHPGATQSVDEINALEKAGRSTSSHTAHSNQSKIHNSSGILDRVLQAVQGVIRK